MTFLTFLFAAAILAITPGPGIAYVVARTVAGGRREGFASCLGTGFGGLVHVFATALGLSLVLANSAWAFNLIKYIGAAYLIFMGVRILKRRKHSEIAPAASAQGTWRAFTEGALVEAFNVKTALFFVAFLPQFIVPSAVLVPQLVLLGCVCVLLNTLADVIAVFGAVHLLKSSATQAGRAKMLNRISGATMIVLGVFLSTARRGM
ncbi:LysE family translocator [uncultured Propionivibrio sp.]|uniref:LysE family translocator n=1 Tax=uncultured Propionivibrio sp. TaxID=426737 RepID=UPI0029BFB412|nr:LysE family translocator [uncultured Propionivibrio sp.]